MVAISVNRYFDILVLNIPKGDNMKKKLPLFLELAALGLVACTGNQPSSSSSQEDPGSSEDVPSSDTAPSSGDSSQGESSSTPVTGDGWTANELALIKEVVGDHPLPYFDFAAAGYKHTLEKTKDHSGIELLAITASSFPYESLVDVVGAWMDYEGAEFLNNTYSYYDAPLGMTILGGTYGDGSTLEVQFYVEDGTNYLTEGSGTLNVDIYPTALSTTDWDEALTDLNAIIASALSLEGLTSSALPKPSVGTSYLVTSTTGYFGETYPQLRINGVSGYDYLDELVKIGWKAIVDATEGEHYLASPDESLGLLGEFSSDYLLLQFSLNNYATSWPTARIARAMGLVAKEGAAVPTLPEPSFLDKVTSFEVTDSYAGDGGSFYIYLYGEDYSKEYAADLLKAGYKDVNYYYGDIEYSDPNGAVLVYASYYESYGATRISVSTGVDTYFTSWPETNIADAVTRLGGKGSIPAPTFKWDYVSVSDYVSQYGYYEINVKTVGEDGALVNTVNDYKAQLDAADSGWTYDSVQEMWHNADRNIGIELDFSENYGLTIYVEIYSPITASWPSENIASALTDIGVTTSTVIPEESGAGGYQFAMINDEQGSPYGFKVTALNVSSDLAESAYRTKLGNAGWTESVYGDSGSSVFISSDKSLAATIYYDGYYKILTLSFYNLSKSPWGNWKAEVEAVVAEWKFDYPSLDIPLPAVAANTLGYPDLSYADTYSVDFYVFDDTFAEAYSATLAEAGWTSRANMAETYSVDYYFTFFIPSTDTTAASTWYLYIEVDEANNTFIYISIDD